MKARVAGCNESKIILKSMYEISLLKNSTLEIRHRDSAGKTVSILAPLTEAIPMIFEAATAICKSPHFDAATGYGEFHALIKELQRRGTI